MDPETLYYKQLEAERGAVLNAGYNLDMAGEFALVEHAGPLDFLEDHGIDNEALKRAVVANAKLLAACKAALRAMTNQRYLKPRQDMIEEHEMCRLAIEAATDDHA